MVSAAGKDAKGICWRSAQGCCERVDEPVSYCSLSVRLGGIEACAAEAQPAGGRTYSVHHTGLHRAQPEPLVVGKLEAAKAENLADVI